MRAETAKEALTQVMTCDLGLQPGICVGPLPIRFYGMIIVLGIIVVGFIVLVIITRRFQRRLKDGDVFLSYLIGYPAHRILLESLRPDAWTVAGGGLATAQLVSIVLIVIALGLLDMRHRFSRAVSTA